MLRVLRSSSSSAPKFFTTISPFATPPRFSSIADSAPYHKIKIPRKWGDHATFDAYVVGEDDAPGIVVLQDWLGVDYRVKYHALRISQLGRGFKVLIPDLYRGNVRQLFKGYDWEGVVLDVYSSVEWLKTKGSKKVGELDEFVDFSDVEAAKDLDNKLRESRVFYEVYIYPG